MLHTKLLIISISLLFFYTHAYGNNIEGNFNKAQLAISNGEFRTALIHMKNALNKQPDNISYRLFISNIYIDIGEAALSKAEINKARQLGAKKNQYHILEIKADLILGNTANVISTHDNILSYPIREVAIIRALQARAYLQTNNIDNAKNLILRATNLAPDELEVKIAQILMYSLEKNWPKVRELLIPLYKEKPHHNEILIFVANLYSKEKKHQNALTIYEKILKQQPNNLAAKLGQTTTLLNLKQYELADLQITKLLDAAPDFEQIHYLNIISAFQQKKYRRAYRSLISIEKLNPDNKDINLLIATSAYYLHDYKKAESRLLEFLDDKPKHLTAIKQLAVIYLSQNKPDRVIPLLKEFENNQDNEIFNLLATAYNLLGNFKKGQEIYLKITQSNTNSTIQSYHLLSKINAGQLADIIFKDFDFQDFSNKGLIYISNEINKGNFDESIKLLQQYQQKNPDNPALLSLLGSAYFKKNLDDKAKALFHKALKLDNKFILARINLARIAIKQNNLNEAENQFHRALSIDPTNNIILIGLAKVSELQNNSKNMIKWLNQARETNSQTLEPRIILNNYYIKHKDYKNALILSEELLEISPDNIKILNAHAEALMQQKIYFRAIATLEKITTQAPRSALAWYRLGSAQYIYHKYNHALESIHKALQLEQNNLKIQYLLVKLYLKQKKYELALNLATQIKSDHPEKALGPLLLGDINTQTKNHSVAIEYYQQALSKQEDNMMVRKLFNALVNNKQQQQAYDLLETWLSKHPQDKNIRFIAGLNYQLNNLPEKAKQHYETYLQQKSDNIDVIYNLALVYNMLGDTKSLEFAEIAYSMAPDKPETNDTLGWILLKYGNKKKALELLKYASDMMPYASDIVYHYAEALAQNNRQEEALSKLNLIIPSNKEYKEKQAAEKLLQQLKSVK